MRGRLVLFGGIGAAVLLALGIGAWFLFFSDDAPDEVDIVAANEQLDQDLAEPEGVAQGETVEVEATGDLTIHGVTNQATFSLTEPVALPEGATTASPLSPVPRRSCSPTTA